MNAAHLHLMLNHFPLVGLALSTLVLVIGLYQNNETIVRVGLFIIVFSALLAVPTFLAGEPAEDFISKFPEFSKNRVELHEEAAEYAIWFIALAFAAAIAGLWQSFRKSGLSKTLLLAIIIINSVSLAAISRTAYLGGMISHPEIRE